MIFTDICLVSEDVPRLRRFYEALFGVAGEGDEWHATVAAAGLNLTFDSAQELAGTGAFGYTSAIGSDNTLICFTVDDVDAEYARVRRLGATLLNAPTTHPWGARSFQFRDPDGNILNFRTVLR